MGSRTDAVVDGAASLVGAALDSESVAFFVVRPLVGEAGAAATAV